MKTNLLTALLIGGLIGCDGKSDSGETAAGDDTGTPGVDTTDDSLTPTEGSWYATDPTISSDECGIFADAKKDDEDEPVTLTVTSETSFSLSDGEDFAVDCAFDSTTGAFDCGSSDEVNDFSKKGFDAVLTFTQTITGTLLSSTDGLLDMTIDVTCEGKDCEVLASYSGLTFPCSSLISYTISHSE